MLPASTRIKEAGAQRTYPDRIRGETKQMKKKKPLDKRVRRLAEFLDKKGWETGLSLPCEKCGQSLPPDTAQSKTLAELEAALKYALQEL
jgi:hypothetical protein